MQRSRLYVTGSRAPRPAARRVAFCDGGRDATFREDVDLELSHWIPNATPADFKADTSTEICLRYVAAPGTADIDLVINNHVDVDGVLSTFVLLHPEISLQHRATLIEAASMGDFGGWGDTEARHLAQSLLWSIQERDRVDPLDLYQQCFQRVLASLAGERFAECVEGLQALAASDARIAAGSVARTQLSEHFVHYAVPRALAEPDLAAALYIPPLNAPLSRAALLWPQARARHDFERVQLISVAIGEGHYYDLWYPGYVWADTVSLWRAPGVRSAVATNDHRLEYSALTAAVAELNRLETAAGQWLLATRLSPFVGVAGRDFPVVLSFLRGGEPAASGLPCDVVSGLLAPLFASSCIVD